MTQPRIEIGVLGASTLRVDGAAVPLGARRMRSLLAALVLGPGRTVSADRLVDAVWDGRPTGAAGNTLQGYVSRLRRLVEPERESSSDPRVLLHEAGAYALRLDQTDRVDARTFDVAVTTAQEHLSNTQHDLTRPGIAADPARVEREQQRLRDALGLWRGEPFLDLGDHAPAAAERRRLQERRVEARTAVVVMDLMLGRAQAAAVALEELVATHPLREQLWRLWAVALVRCDRQAHALEVLARLRTHLAAELGIDPSPAVRHLQEDILRQHPAVLATPAPSAPAAPPPLDSPAPASSLVGRDRELRALQDAVHHLDDGRPQHAVVVGDAGMGKTRLTAELLAWVRESDRAATIVVRGNDAGPPPGGLLRAARGLAAGCSLVAPDTSALDVPQGRDAEARPEAVARVVAELVHQVATVRPVLLLAEDVQWTDPVTVETLRVIVDSLTDVPVMVLVTRRPGPDEPRTDGLAVSIVRTGGLWLDLPGLPRADVAELAAEVLPGLVPTDDVLDHLVDRTNGNPLLLTALLRSERADEVPPAVRLLVRRRVDALPDGAARTLEVAAVLGRRFPVEPLVTAADAAVGLEAARAAHLVHEVADDVWEFANGLVHEAVLTSIRPLDRAAVQARVVDTLAGTVGSSPRPARLRLVPGSTHA